MATVSFKCSSEERARLQRAADAVGQNLSEYLRTCALGAETPSNSRYASLAHRVQTLESAFKLANLDDAITQAQKMLGGKEQDGNRNQGEGQEGE